jgi:hypothetical protein
MNGEVVQELTFQGSAARFPRRRRCFSPKTPTRLLVVGLLFWDGVQRVDENDCSRARCISCRKWNAGFCVSIKPSSTVVAVVSALAKVLCKSVNRLSPSEERSPRQTPAVSPPGCRHAPLSTISQSCRPAKIASVGKLRCLGHKRLLPIRRPARRVPRRYTNVSALVNRMAEIRPTQEQTSHAACARYVYRSV